MKRILFGVAVFLAISAADAQIYQWKDDNGKTVISDKPPSGPVKEQRKIETESTGGIATGQKTIADRDLDFRKRQKEAQDNAEKAKKQQTAAADKAENCANARRQLTTLESGERISMRDDKGERYYLDDAQRQQEIVRTRQIVAQSCQ